MKVLGPFYLGLQEIWPIVASQFFSSTSLGLPIFLAQNQEWSFFIPLLWFQKNCPTIVANHFFWFHFPGPSTKVGSAVISSLLLGPPIFLAHWWHSSSVFSLTSFLLYRLLFHDFFMDLSWIFHDLLWIFQRFFMKFHGWFMDFSSKFWSTGASLVHICCKLAPLVCNFDANLMPVWC